MKSKWYSQLMRIAGFNGKKDLKVVGIMYAVLLVAVLLMQSDEMPIKPIHIILLPVIFFGAALCLYGLSSLISFLYKRLSLPLFVLACATLFTAWIMAMAAIMANIEVGSPLPLIAITVVVVGMAIYLAIRYTFPWSWEIRCGKMKALPFCATHVGLMVLAYILVASTKLALSPSANATTYSFTSSAIFCAVLALLAYLLLSLNMTLRVIFYLFTAKRSK